MCSSYNGIAQTQKLGEHLHPELWLRGYDSDKSATLNVNAAEVIDTWSNGDKQDESVYKTTRKGTIKVSANPPGPSARGSFSRSLFQHKPL